MNILPKKSWHVRNKNNIERVRKDEENARKEEEEIQRRAALANSEARTELLRKKAQIRQRNSDDVHEETTGQQLTSPTSQQAQHINFFSDLEDGKKTKKGNEEYEKEKKEEKEKQEKAIGLLTYLGQSSIESLGANKPWYFSAPEKKGPEDGQKLESLIVKERDTKTKYAQDPMKMMSKYIGTKHKVEGKPYRQFIPLKPRRPTEDVRPQKRKRSTSSSSSCDNSTSSSSSSSEEERRKRKKHKKKHKKKAKKRKKKKQKKEKHSSREKAEKVSGSTPTATKTIQQLRAERLKREQAERMKTQKLLHRVKDGKDHKEESDSEKVETDDRKRGYNSQYNPELARSKKKPKIDYTDFD